MSEENVEAFKRGVEAHNNKEYDALLEVFSPAVEWHAVFQVMFGGEPTVLRGREGVREYVRDFDEAFAERHLEMSDFRDLGERIVAIGQVRGRGRVSGAEIVPPISFLAEFRDGRIFRMSDYLDSTKALEAAGLRE